MVEKQEFTRLENDVFSAQEPITEVASADAEKSIAEPRPVQILSRNFGNIRNRRIIAFIVLITGIGLVLYPVIATLINNDAHQKVVQDTLKKSQDLSPNVLETELKKAEEYNQEFSQGPILDPFLQKVVPDSPEYHEYLKLLDFSGVMGSVNIPKIGVKLPIYHGTDDATLDKGVGHLFGSSLPVGGESTKSVLTAHSGLGNATMFDDLPNLKPGDEVFLQIGGKTLKYSVTGSEVVLPDNTKDLQIEAGRDLIVLITCTPYSVNTHRLLVTAERVPYDPATDKAALAEVPSPWRMWMWFSILVVLFALGLQFWLIWRKYKKRRAESPNNAKDLVSQPAEIQKSEGFETEKFQQDLSLPREGEISDSQ